MEIHRELQRSWLHTTMQQASLIAYAKKEWKNTENEEKKMWKEENMTAAVRCWENMHTFNVGWHRKTDAMYF